MKDIYNYLKEMKEYVASIIAKPMFGITTSTGASLLLWLKLLSPAATFLTIIIGLAAARYSFLIKRADWQMKQIKLKRLLEHDNKKAAHESGSDTDT